MFIARDGPYRTESLTEPVERYRKTLHRHHYQYLEAPCFRVARDFRVPWRRATLTIGSSQLAPGL